MSPHIIYHLKAVNINIAVKKYLLIGIRLIAYLLKRLRESSTIKQPRKLIMHRKLLQSTVGILEHGQESVRGFSVSDNTEYRRNILAELG